MSHKINGLDRTACSMLFVLSFTNFSSRKASRKGFFYATFGFIVIMVYQLLYSDKYYDKIYLPFIIYGVSTILGIIVGILINVNQIPIFITICHISIGISNIIHGLFTISYFKCKKTNTTDQFLRKIHRFEILASIILGFFTVFGALIFTLKQKKILENSQKLPKFFFHLINKILFIGIIFSCIFNFCTDLFDESSKFLIFIVINSCVSTILSINYNLAININEIQIHTSVLNVYNGLSAVLIGFSLQRTLVIFGGVIGITIGTVLVRNIAKISNIAVFNIFLGKEYPNKKIYNKINNDQKANTINDNNLAKFIVESRRIIIVPGFGMALSQSQYLIKELINILLKMEKNVRICIHPLSGRLPGHLNVLLDEAGISSGICFDMMDINDDFENCDLALVIGGNDIVNCATEEDERSPIYGMKVCKVWNAKKCVVMKRSLSTGYNNIENPLFSKENTFMFLGDAYENLIKLLNIIKNEVSMRNNLNGSETNELHSRKNTFESKSRSIIKYLNIGIPKEYSVSEKRVSIIPSFISKFENLGFNVFVEKDAGENAGFSDDDYIKEGAIIMNKNDLYEVSDVIIKIYPPLFENNEYENYKNTKFLIYNNNRQNKPEIFEFLSKFKQLSVLSIDLISDKFDAYDYESSISNVLGYRAIIDAFYHLDFMNQVIPGKNKPNKVLIIGSGIISKPLILNAKKLGAKVFVYENNNPIIESLGAESIRFIWKNKFNINEEESLFLEKYLVDINILILIPHKRTILKTEMLSKLKNGSIIVDLTGDYENELEIFKRNEIYNHNSKINIIGTNELLSKIPKIASEIYSEYIYHIIEEICNDGKDSISAKNFDIDKNNRSINQILKIRNGKIKIHSHKNKVSATSNLLCNESFEINLTDEDMKSDKSEPLIEKNTIEAVKKPSRIKEVVITLVYTLIFFTSQIITTLYAEKIHKSVEVFLFELYLSIKIINHIEVSLYTPILTLASAILSIESFGESYHEFKNEMKKCGNNSIIMISDINIFISDAMMYCGLFLTYKLLNFENKNKKKQ